MPKLFKFMTLPILTLAVIFSQMIIITGRYSTTTLAPENISEAIIKRIDELVANAFKNLTNRDERGLNTLPLDQFNTSIRAATTCAELFHEDKSCKNFEFCCRVACKVVDYGCQPFCSAKESTAALVCLCGRKHEINSSEKNQFKTTTTPTDVSTIFSKKQTTTSMKFGKPSTRKPVITMQGHHTGFTIAQANHNKGTAATEKGPQKNNEFRKCGQPTVQTPVGDRILGGQEATKKAWPWQVSIQRNGRHICGGSLIDATHVLTAAHCVEKDPDERHYQVILGLYDLDSNEESDRVQIEVEDIHIHPGRRSPSPSYDAAIIKLSGVVTYSDSILPICLPKQEPPMGTQCMTAGWGQENPEISELSKKLMEAVLTVVNRTQCIQKANFGKLIDSSMICAENHLQGPCKGDSGGPLMCKIDGESWELHGITSFAAKACSLSDPTVFVNVYSIIQWIKSTSGNDNSIPMTTDD